MPINFRTATKADYLGSYLREEVLSSLPAHEINLEIVTRGFAEDSYRKYTLTDDRNPLDDWQDSEALDHWKLMRKVLPAVHWETY